MRLIALEKDFAFAIGCNAVNLSLIACRDQQIAIPREGQRPDVFGLRIVEYFRLVVPADSVNLAVRRSGGIDAIARVHSNRMDLERIQLRQHASLAALRNHKEFGPGAASSVKVSFRI